jgi:hypothetical protein
MDLVKKVDGKAWHEPVRHIIDIIESYFLVIICTVSVYIKIIVESNQEAFLKL